MLARKWPVLQRRVKEICTNFHSRKPFSLLFSVGCVFKEMLLKRAADLVEALYGTPHNNQVILQYLIYKGLHRNLWACFLYFALQLQLFLLMKRTSFWRGLQTLLRLCTVSPETTISFLPCPAPLFTVAWWDSTPMGDSLELQFQTHRPITRVSNVLCNTCLCHFFICTQAPWGIVCFSHQRPLVPFIY